MPPSSPKRVSVCLIQGCWSANQWSMDLYREELISLLGKQTGAFHISVVHPPEQLRLPFQRHWARWFTLPRLLAARQTDLYHCLEPGDIVAARNLDLRKVIVTCHDLIPWRFKTWRNSFPPKRWIRYALYQRMTTLLSRSAKIISPSDCTRKDLLECLGIPKERIAVIPYSLSALFYPLPPQETLLVREELCNRWRLPANASLFLHVGSNLFYKNIENLLRAFHLFVRWDPSSPAFLIRAGDRLTKGQSDLAQHLGIAHRIVCTGPQTPEELANLYRSVDVFVFPSYYEGFGRPALEALASGTPVVAGTGGALPEVVGEAGVLINPSDPKAIATAMQQILQNSALRADLKRKSSLRAAFFRKQDISAALQAVYQEVARNNRRTRS